MKRLTYELVILLGVAGFCLGTVMGFWVVRQTWRYAEMALDAKVSVQACHQRVELLQKRNVSLSQRITRLEQKQ